MTWAAKRRWQYVWGLLGVFLVVLFIFLYPVIFKKPTCTDNKKNGDEIGIDCGGSCLRMCNEETSDPAVLWYRAFPVVGSYYNLVALVENQNTNSAIENVTYQFRVYDVNNKMIGRRDGSTFIPPNKQFAIFEARFDAGAAVVKSVSFEFTGPLVWIKKEPTLNTLPIYVDNIAMGEDLKNPSLTARVKNESVNDLPTFDAIAILYDKDRNAINASKTFKDGIPSGGFLSLYFTWPEAFSVQPVTEEVLISINPFTVSF